MAGGHDYRSDDNISTLWENTMIRKSILALAAIATVGAAALAPTSASAWGYKGWGWGHGPGFGLGFGHGYYGAYYAPRVVHYAHDCYLVKRINRHGIVRFVRVCS
jgi:hypothetical protein